MRYFLIAGERSGDLHGSNLIKALKDLDQEAEFYGLGGEQMQREGMKIFLHYNEISFMGFAEVVMNLRKISRVIKRSKREILNYQPDVLILLDFAGFNLRMAEFAKSCNIKVAYYISPKIWAWKQNRALKVKKWVDRMFVIMPFEKDFYKKFNYEVEYVGNPVMDAVCSFKPEASFKANSKIVSPVIALLPGSRKQEVQVMACRVLPLVEKFSEYEFVVAGVSNLDKTFYNDFIDAGIKVVYDSAYDLLAISDAAIVTSGTATLETALFNVPQVVVYKANAITYLIAKSLIKIPYISLVNLIAGKEVVKELIQDKFSPLFLETELKKILREQDRLRVLNGYNEVREQLGQTGASIKAAKGIFNMIK